MLISCVLAIIIGTAQAEQLKNLSEARKLTDTAMDLVLKNEYEEVVDVIKKYWLIDENKVNVLQSQIKAQKSSILENYGKAIGTEFIKQEKIGDSIVKIIQISKHEKYALVWQFVFYKAKDEWSLVNFSYDDKILELFNK